MQLRPYQQDINDEIHQAWQVVDNIAVVLPCGGGKTVVFSHILSQHQGASIAIAHRQELVCQMSLALAKFGVKHRIIGTNSIIKWIVYLHMQEVGQSFYDPNSLCGVAGVQTLVRRAQVLRGWLERVNLWVTDEMHHLLKKNSWGKSIDLLPQGCKGLGVTATPLRADGKGLGRHHDGIMDTIIEGPTMRDLISMKYLTDYRIFAPPSNFSRENIPVTRSGDFSPEPLKNEVRKSTIMGDIVSHYLRITPGQLGITFVTDVETAGDVAAQFRQVGVPTEAISARTPDKERMELIARFKRGDLKQLVNVDIFGEGFDLPALEVVQMARPTESYGLYTQQFGRSLRIMENKRSAVIIDHVGNVQRHGLPDSPRVWTLDRRDRKSNGSDGTIPVRTCRPPQGCMGVYEAFHRVCPYCGEIPVPVGRSRPEMVDGDLMEMDPAALAVMRGEVDRIDTPVDQIRHRLSHGMSGVVLGGAVKNHQLRQEAQVGLRDSIALWAGYGKAAGMSDSEMYKRFYFGFGVDVLTAQTLGRVDASDLETRVRRAI